jgi:hypothetical protein
MSAIADLSAKAYSHNLERVQRYLCSIAKTAQAAAMDTGLHGRVCGDGPQFHL